jgi:hypothetical protein
MPPQLESRGILSRKRLRYQGKCEATELSLGIIASVGET